MTNLSTLLAIFGYAIAATIGAASLVALFRARYIKASVEELRNDRDDQAKRINRLEIERNELQAINDRFDVTISDQAAQIKVLKDALSGKEQLNHLQSQIDSHDQRVDERHNQLSKTLEKLVENDKILNDNIVKVLARVA